MIDAHDAERARRRWQSAATQIGCTLAEYTAHREDGQKWCYRCRAWLPVDDFGVNLHHSDGRHGMCRVCKSAYDRQYNAARAARLAEKERLTPPPAPQISPWRPGRRDAPPASPGAQERATVRWWGEVGIYAAAKAKRLAAREARRAEREQA